MKKKAYKPVLNTSKAHYHVLLEDKYFYNKIIVGMCVLYY